MKQMNFLSAILRLGFKRILREFLVENHVYFIFFVSPAKHSDT